MSQATAPNRQALMHTWDRQQQGYVPQREQLLTTMLDTTSLALHVGALAEAGFREVDTIWQDLNRRLLLAVR